MYSQLQLIVTIAALAAHVNSFPTDSIPSVFISEGVPVTTTHFHNQAYIRIGLKRACGGIIFDSTTIITAAHWYLND